MKLPLALRAGLVSRRLILSGLILVASGALVVIPADAFARHRQMVEARAGHAAAVAQSLAATETSQVQALGEQLARTYENIFVRVERDFQHFFQLLHLASTTEIQATPVAAIIPGGDSALAWTIPAFRPAPMLSHP